jgi:hypothetical protein
MILHLSYDTIPVGDISDPFCDQGTWFGDFHECIDPAAGPLHYRLHEFIRFCRHWNSECTAGTGGDASDFDQFSDLLKSQWWLTSPADGVPTRLDGPPNFWDDEISWVHPEQHASSAASAQRA